jgi:hypothetical protein
MSAANATKVEAVARTQRHTASIWTRPHDLRDSREYSDANTLITGNLHGSAA